MDDKNYRKFLQKYIDEVLHYVWDPIGISDTPEARDEYSTYADGIYRLVINNATSEDIINRLMDIEKDRMGLEVTLQAQRNTQKVSELILDWSQYLKSDMSLHLIDKNQ